MDEAAFEQSVREAVESLPPEFAERLHNIEILIEDEPTAAHRRAVDLAPEYTLYGLYQGVPLPERAGDAPLVPDVVTIFRGPLVRDFPDQAALHKQVRRTVLHELAHYFGISDERLHDLDAY